MAAPDPGPGPPVTWDGYGFGAYDKVLDGLAVGERLYSAAYIVPPPQLGEARKRSNICG